VRFGISCPFDQNQVILTVKLAEISQSGRRILQDGTAISPVGAIAQELLRGTSLC